MVPKPFSCAEPTGPSTYRTIDRHHPTLIIDEAGDLFRRKSDLRAIINASWTRGTYIPREGREFDPFCPKILGVTGRTKLPRDVASRCIPLTLWPRRPDEKIEDFGFDDDSEFDAIRRKLARWAADSAETIKGVKPSSPPELTNRSRANWRLLLQVAQHAGGNWPEQAHQAAVVLSRTPFDPSWGVRLLAAMRAMFVNRAEITSQDVRNALLADPDSEWRAYRGRGPITLHQIAALLKDYEIHPAVLHPTRRASLSRRGYRASQFDDMFARFLRSDPNIRTQTEPRRRK